MTETKEFIVPDDYWPFKPRGQAPLEWVIQDKRDEYSEELMSTILGYREIGKSFREIAKLVNKSEWQIKSLFRKLRKEAN